MAAATTFVPARSFTSAYWPRSMPSESPSTRVRSGEAWVNFGNGLQPSASTTAFLTLITRWFFTWVTIVVAGGTVAAVGGPVLGLRLPAFTATTPLPPRPIHRSAVSTTDDRPRWRDTHEMGRRMS